MTQPVHRHLLLLSLLVVQIIPYLSRLPGIMFRGWEWFTDYLPGLGAFLFFSSFNLIPGLAMYGLGRGSRTKPLAFRGAVTVGVMFMLLGHGTLDLRSSSTAAIALIVIPLYAVVAMAMGWAVGLLAHLLRDRWKR